jgi:hypothetical protein
LTGEWIELASGVFGINSTPVKKLITSATCDSTGGIPPGDSLTGVTSAELSLEAKRQVVESTTLPVLATHRSVEIPCKGRLECPHCGSARDEKAAA